MEYNKKVKEHFLNPKNVGEIKNADGVGEVGNPVCLLPDEKVHKNSNIKKIAELNKTERVLTHSGKYENIINKSVRSYNGKVISLTNKLGKINLTPEHLIYAMKVPKKLKFLRNKGKKELIPEWYHAEDLKKGDIALYPIFKEEKDVNQLEIDIPKLKYDFKSLKLPKYVPLNSKLLRLFGYFLAEGHIEDKPSKTYISFTLNIKEKDIAEDISQTAEELLGIQTKIKEIPAKKTLVVFIYNAQLARVFKNLFNNGAENKKLPDFIMNLPAEKQKSLIYGLWKGDGYVNLNRNGPRAGYATISYQLAQQIKILLIRQKIAPSIYEDKARVVGRIKHKRSYRIHIGQRDSLVKLSSILNIEYNPKSYASVDSWFDSDYLYTPITQRNTFDYLGEVHNLEVNNAHSFVSEAFTLHNCGDVMRVSIKVEKKNGKEIVKDIKFRTMGCAAAIATSSMVTELAKGKTIEQAEKITRNDVADELGGLPPLKMHCSNLAADALRKAIEDYRKKK